MSCIGRIRVCSFCGRKFWDTEETILLDENSDEVMLCCTGDVQADQAICLNGWKNTRPGLNFNFIKKKLTEVQPYFTWPPELVRVA